MKTKKLMLERLKTVIDESRVKSIRQFALSINADPSYFTKILKGEKDISTAVLDAIEEKYGLNAKWIVGESEEKYGLVPREIKRSGAVPDHRDEIIVLLKEKCDRLEKDYSDSMKQLSANLDSLAAGQEAIAQIQTESLQVLFELLKGKLKDKSADELMTTVLDRSFANQEKAGKRGKSFDGNKSRK